MKSRTPFPVVEAIAILLFSLTFTNFLGETIFSGSPDLENFRASALEIIHYRWYLALRQSFLIIGFLFSIFMSLSIASEYENGVMNTIIVLPISRSEYLGSKCLYYYLLIVGSQILSVLFVLLLSPEQLALIPLLSVMFLIVTQPLLYLSVPVLFSIYLKKSSSTIILSLIAVLLNYIISPTIKYPMRYLLEPLSLLLTKDYGNGLIFGLLIPSGISIIILMISFYKLSRMDLTGGNV